MQLVYLSRSFGIGDIFWKSFDHEEGSKMEKIATLESVEDDGRKKNKNEDEQNKQEMKVDEKDKPGKEPELYVEEDEKSMKKPEVNVEEDEVKEDEAQAKKEQEEELKSKEKSTLEDNSEQHKPTEPMEVASHESNEKHVGQDVAKILEF
eukprot:Gb_18772 [translate_table: standard]